LAFGVILLLVRRCLPVHGVILSFFAQFTLRSCIRVGAELHLILMAYDRLLSSFRSSSR
jgi:hypothetical protein